MSFGGDADEADVRRACTSACRDAGINFFDTADNYNEGRSEEILGELMRGHRDDLVVATKCFIPSGDDVNARGSSRRHIARAVEASLKRLRTDRIDVLFLHQLDPQHAARGDAARARGPGARGQDRSTRRSATTRPGRRSTRSTCRSAHGWARAAGDPADVQPGQAPGRGRDPADGAGQRPRRVPLQPRRAVACCPGSTWRSPVQGRLVDNKMYDRPLRRALDARGRGEVRRLLQAARPASR